MTTQTPRTTDHADEPTQRGGRTAPSWALIGLGYVCIVVGGLVAAVTGPLDLAYGSWAAAYLVLVGGIAQLALGWIPGRVGRPSVGRSAWAVVVTWNVGNAAVIAATAAGVPWGVDLGSALLVVGLVLAIVALLRRGGSAAEASGLRSPGRLRLLAVAYLCLLVVLAVSIPVGIVLSYLRS